MNKKQLAGYAIVALAFGVLGSLAATRNGLYDGPVTTAYAATGAATQSVASALFAQSFNDAAGRPQKLAQWQGKPLLVNFWAPWCAPCVQEMPELSAIAAKDGGKKFNVIGIGIDSPSNIAEFAAKFKIAYPLYVAGMGGTELSRQFGNSNGGLPYTVLIGADGQVRKTYLGRLKFDELRRDLSSL